MGLSGLSFFSEGNQITNANKWYDLGPFQPVCLSVHLWHLELRIILSYKNRILLLLPRITLVWLCLPCPNLLTKQVEQTQCSRWLLPVCMADSHLYSCLCSGWHTSYCCGYCSSHPAPSPMAFPHKEQLPYLVFSCSGWYLMYLYVSICICRHICI